MSFREIDEIHRSNAVMPMKNRNRKRKGLGGESTDDKSTSLTERRTGRWTNEETTYCDMLIAKFETGELPVADGLKLNEFLGNMLKSKQSRLTKKMKNAKLSTKMFQRHTGYLDANDAREFSEQEDFFIQSISELQERAEIKFHMQKEWREQLSRVCTAIGQPLDADAWLSSVEEMDRRVSKAKDAARIKKRKLMMDIALRTDTKNLEHGVFIEQTEMEARAFGSSEDCEDEKELENEMLGLFAEDKGIVTIDASEKSSLLHASPFLAKAIAYLERHNFPFEHIDIWVPSFVPTEFSQADQTSCRLCYAGNATVDKLITEDGKTSRPLGQEEQFNFYAFGSYSQKFSFDVGCGLPGRVYESGRPTWEQSVHNAPSHHFERCGGAKQWGLKTVVGIPIASPNVGRIVVALYSCFERVKDEELVARLSEEFTRVCRSAFHESTFAFSHDICFPQLMPSPKWKLVVDIGNFEELTPVSVAASAALPTTNSDTAGDGMDSPNASVHNFGASAPISVSIPTDGGRDTRVNEVISLLGKFMPSDPVSPHAPYVSGFMSLRLLLLRQTRGVDDDELVRTMLDSYSSYQSGGRDDADIAVMLARDFLFLAQQQQQQSFIGMNHNRSASHNGQGQGGGPVSNSGLPLFDLPSIRSNIQNSPTLTPIPAPGSIDALSIVSH